MSAEAAYDVVIIGGGPAGLSAAMELRRRGLSRILVLEREAEAGGIPRHCSHPPFGFREYGRIMTGPAYARRNVEQAKKSGVEIRTLNAATALHAGGRVSVTGPACVSEVTGRRVLLCLGAREAPRSARLIGGTRPIGVINTGALQVSANLKGLRPFQRPLIVGTELVSLSSILTCRHAGIRPVAVIESSNVPIARWPLALFPRICGIPLHLAAELVAIEGERRVESVMVRFGDGALRRIACDGVLLTGQFTPESALLRGSGLAIDPGTGGPRVDQFGRCSDKSYFAAGNLLRPIETAGWCWREGRRIGALIAQDLVEELPHPEGGIEIRVQAPLRYAMPQALVPGQAPADLQLRVSWRVEGMLTASQSGTVLVTRRGVFRPERRILLTLPGQLQPGAPVEIRVAQAAEDGE
jgi:thioredoxin reductase